jgi:hypothetical protein
MEILYSSADLRDAITKILAKPTPGERRVVLTAFCQWTGAGISA